MKKYPKYIVLPVAMTIYFIAMTIYGLKMNGWKLVDDFWTICCAEIVIIVVLFYALRWLDRRRRE